MLSHGIVFEIKLKIGSIAPKLMLKILIRNGKIGLGPMLCMDHIKFILSYTHIIITKTDRFTHINYASCQFGHH